ncbi:MAG: SAVED domain-containing protein [Candidatus Cloacimonetes bacterium]|jgi:hypothetical protein|nr:SAVED domain-containing protein [Candidatus Cloacimonadota bacterium]
MELLKLVNAIIDLIEKDLVNGLILLVILIIILFIISILSYKNNRLLQRLVNKIPFIRKEYVLVANFSKKEGKIDEIIKDYMEYGCKVFKLYTFRDFDKDGTITKEKLENIVKRQQKTIQKAKRIMKNGNSLIYIGFPHVPLGFLDGVNFSDIDDPILYEYQGMDSECLGKGFFELKRIYNTEIEIEQTLNNYDSLDKEVVLKIEQSFKINDDDIKKVVNVSSIVSLSSSKIGRWKITNYAQIDKYQREFEKMLTEMKAKGVEKIHLFATTPVSLSFSLGRVINHYHPEIIVYNYNNGTFDWGINLQNREIIEPVSQ